MAQYQNTFRLSAYTSWSGLGSCWKRNTLQRAEYPSLSFLSWSIFFISLGSTSQSRPTGWSSMKDMLEGLWTLCGCWSTWKDMLKRVQYFDFEERNRHVYIVPRSLEHYLFLNARSGLVGKHALFHRILGKESSMLTARKQDDTPWLSCHCNTAAS